MSTETELYSADEIFFCGTGQEIVPVTSVDRIPVGNGSPGPITRQIQEIYFDICYGRSEKYRDWVESVAAA